MFYPKVLVRIGYLGPEDPQYPVVIVRVKDCVPGFLIAKLEEQGYFVEVETEPTHILTVTAKVRTRRLEMTAHLIGIIKAWHDECCGVSQIVRTLLLQTDYPGFETIRHTPSEDSAMVRLGTLKVRQELAIFIEDYEEAEQLQHQIDSLAAGSPV